MPDKKILLVDDDPKVTAISSHLEKLDFKMFNALDGEKALEIVKSERPGLVILDMQLPGIDGLEILTTLRNDYKDIKVFVFTAHGEQYKKKAEKIGFDQYFDKSVYDLDTLLDAIRDVFSIEKIIERKELKPLKKVPKAKLLFIEPSVQMYSITSCLFDNPNFCIGEYERKVLYGSKDYLAGIILDELATYTPDIVLINDYAMEEGDILNLIDLIKGVKIKPEEIIVHGLFERNTTFETRLKIKKVKRCIQNIMKEQQLVEWNQRLIDFVNQECVEHGLIKK